MATYEISDDKWSQVKATIERWTNKNTAQMITAADGSSNGRIYTMKFCAPEAEMVSTNRVAFIALARLLSFGDGILSVLALTSGDDAVMTLVNSASYRYAYGNTDTNEFVINLKYRAAALTIRAGAKSAQVLFDDLLKYAMVAARVIRSKGGITRLPFMNGVNTYADAKWKYAYLHAQCKQCIPQGAKLTVGGTVITVDSLATPSEFNATVDKIAKILKSSSGDAAALLGTLDADDLDRVLNNLDNLALLVISYYYSMVKSITKRLPESKHLSHFEAECATYLPTFLARDLEEYAHGASSQTLGWQPRNAADPQPFALVTGRLYNSVAAAAHAKDDAIPAAAMRDLQRKGARLAALAAALTNTEVLPVLWLTRDSMEGLQVSSDLLTFTDATEEAVAESIGSPYRVGQLAQQPTMTRGVRRFDRLATLNTIHHMHTPMAAMLQGYSSASQMDPRLRERLWTLVWNKIHATDTHPSEVIPFVHKMQIDTSLVHDTFDKSPMLAGKLADIGEEYKNACWLTADVVYEVPKNTPITAKAIRHMYKVPNSRESDEAYAFIGTADDKFGKKVRITFVTIGGVAW